MARNKNQNIKAIVKSTVTYGAEPWETGEHMRTRLLAMEMRYWRRWCRLTLQDGVKIEEIREGINI